MLARWFPEACSTSGRASIHRSGFVSLLFAWTLHGQVVLTTIQYNNITITLYYVPIAIICLNILKLLSRSFNLEFNFFTLPCQNKFVQ